MFAADNLQQGAGPRRADPRRNCSGYIWESEVNRLFRATKLLEIGAGTTEVRKIIISEDLRRIGATAAKYLLFTGDTQSAAELVPLGLVNRVVPDAELTAEVEKLAARIASKSPLVLRRMKQAVADGLEQPEAAALRMERLVLEAHRHSYDIREGLAAFVGKRKPEFKGY
jgi:hypothetical protein